MFVAQIATYVAMHLVASTLRDEVNVAAQCTPKLCLSAVGDDLHLADDIEAECSLDKACGIIISREPVDDEAVRKVVLTGDRYALPSNS